MSMNGRIPMILLVLAACREVPLQPKPPRAAAPAATTVPAVCDVVWAGAVSGEWSDASRWSPAAVPTAADVVCFNAVGSYEVTPPAAAPPLWTSAAEQIRVLPGVSVTFRASSSWQVGTRDLAVDRGGTMALAGSAWLAATGLTSIDGTFTTVDGSYSLTMLETDVLLVSGLLDLEAVSLDINTSGPVGLVSTGEIRLTGSSFVTVNNATLVTLGGAGVTGTGSMELNLMGGTFDWSGGTLPPRPATGAAAPVRIVAWIDLSFTGPHADLTVTLPPQGTGALDVGVHPEALALSVRGDVGASMDLRLENLEPATPFSVDWMPPSTRPSGSVITNAGRFTSYALTLRSTSPLLNTGQWTFSGFTGRLQAPSLRNLGTVAVAGTTRVEQGTLTNTGAIAVGLASSLVFATSDLVVEAAGPVSGAVRLEAGGRLSGNGTLDRVTSVGGVVSPGTSTTPVGSLSFADLTLDATSRVVTDIQGLAAQDRVFASSALHLAGTLDVRTLPPFVGGLCGQVLGTVSLATRTASLTGAFSQVLGTLLSPTRRWRPYTSATSVQLVGHDPSRLLGLSVNALAVAEGGASATTALCLSGTGPTTSITVDATSRLGQSTASPAPLVITPTTWALPQALAVQAINDLLAEPTQVDSIRFRLTSADALYNGVMADQLAVTITDNDQGADLATTLVSAPTSVAANQVFEARYRISNSGPAASTGSTFTVTPLAGMTFVSSTPQVACTAGTGVVTCTAGALASGALVDFTLVYRATTAGTYANTVRVTGNEFDPVAANNAFTWSLTVN